MPTLQELGKKLETVRGEYKSKLDEYVDPAGGFKSVPPEETDKLNKMEQAMNAAHDEFMTAKSLDEKYQANVAEIKKLNEPVRTWSHGNAPAGAQTGTGGPENNYGGMFTGNMKSMGELFTESPAYKGKAQEVGSFSLEAIKMAPFSSEVKNVSLKTTFSTTAGFPPFVPRADLIVPYPQRRLVVADLIPQADTGLSGTRYIEETTFTNNAAAVAEAGTKPEAALALVERTANMSKVAVTLPVTEEQMADVPQIRAYIDNRLTQMLRLEEERELLQGSGTSPEMLGFLNKAGVQTLAQSTMDAFSAILKMVVQIEDTVGFANVSGIITHPLDYFSIRTIKDSTGRFIMGSPDEMGPARLWGVPVVRTVAEPQGTILMGDFPTFSQILRREGITFRVGYVNDQFLKNMMTIVAEFRELLMIYRASAFGTVTGGFTS